MDLLVLVTMLSCRDGLYQLDSAVSAAPLSIADQTGMNVVRQSADECSMACCSA